MDVRDFLEVSRTWILGCSKDLQARDFLRTSMAKGGPDGHQPILLGPLLNLRPTYWLVLDSNLLPPKLRGKLECGPTLPASLARPAYQPSTPHAPSLEMDGPPASLEERGKRSVQWDKNGVVFEGARFWAGPKGNQKETNHNFKEYSRCLLSQR